jgi:hypothetical protein
MPATPIFYSVADIEREARYAGSHFFDRDTMRFFGSRVLDGTYAGRLFVTSEKGPHDDSPRLYTVRVIIPAGRGRRFSIEDVGGFQAFTSSAAAHRAAATAARGPFTVRHDPYPDSPHTGPRHFAWRCYAGDLAIGSRNTRAAARAIRADLERAARITR